METINHITTDVMSILMVEHEELIDATRTRGILNRREREYLLGQSDIEPRSPDERAIRATIRQHVRHAFLDFYILLEELEDRDLEHIFNEASDGSGAFYGGVIHALGLIYRGTKDNESHLLESMLHSAVLAGARMPVEEALFRYSVTFNVDAPEPVNVALIADKLEFNNWHEMTIEELQFFLLCSDKSETSVSDLRGPDVFLDVVEELTEKGEIEVP